MKRKFLGQFKFRMGVALIVIVGVLLANNFFDRQHWSQVEESFSSIYKDRLLVEGYIFKLSDELHSQKYLLHDVAMGIGPENWRLKWTNSECKVQDLLEKFRATHFTLEEDRLFSIFEKEVNQLYALHLEDQKVGMAQAPEGLDLIEGCIALLPDLSEVQLGEGKYLNEESHALASSSYISSTFELAMLILLGLLFEILLFTSRSFVPKFPQKPHLN